MLTKRGAEREKREGESAITKPPPGLGKKKESRPGEPFFPSGAIYPKASYFFFKQSLCVHFGEKKSQVSNMFNVSVVNTNVAVVDTQTQEDVEFE